MRRFGNGHYGGPRVSAGPSRKVFLSVAGPDAARGDRIDRHLRDAGLEVEYYRRSFPQGTNFVKEINSALASCDCMVALLSPAYCNPISWVTEEWQAALVIARERPGFLALFLIEQCQLPPLLAPLSYVNLTRLNEENAEARLLEKLQDGDWTRPALSGARGPAESTWAVAVYGDEHSGALGAGVVIDARRVLTCARVCADLIDENGEPLGPLRVRFSKASPPVPGTQSRRVIGVHLPEGEYDLAVLLLEEAVPAGVRAARLRRPVPEDLVGLGWWAFGFPEGQRLGDEAYGTVGAAAGEGFVRLDARSSCRVETGFSGSGLWSPDYEAVVGIVGAAPTRDGHAGDDRTGDPLASTLFQADRCFGAEGLAGVGGWSAEQAGEVAMSSWGWALRDDPESGPHWRPRARGVGADNEGGYRFRGRRAALTEITGWLGRDRTDRRALVVTGSPGVGKSAVLGRVVTTADPGIRAELPAGDDSVRAVEGSVACAVHAKGKTALNVAREIARAASARLPSRPLDLAPAVRAALAVQNVGRFNVVIDALDEAASPAEARLIVSQVVQPLLQQCADTGAQIVIGTRRQDDVGSLIKAFGNAAVLIDLDADKYFALEDLEAYALATLQQLGSERPNNPYADEDAARPLATRIAKMSGKNFLVAYLTALTHGSFDEAPADLEELAYTMDVRNALHDFLDRFREVDGIPLSATDLLTALAHAEAPGLPIELWITAIEAVYGVRPAEIKLDEFTQSAAANFLVESSQDPDQVFRLYHQALNDTLLDGRARRTVKDQRALTRAFADYGRQVGWGSASPYLLRSLSHHAERARMLDELLTDDEYLLHADLRRLAPQAAQAATDAGHATAAGKQRAQLLLLTPYAASAGPQERRAMFSVTETLEKLGGSFRAEPGPTPYRARWSTATTNKERAAQQGHTGGVLGLCAFILADQTLLASAGEDEMVRIWDPATGQQQQILDGHAGAVNGVHAFTDTDGRVLLASGGADATVRIWDPATGQQQQSLEGHARAVNGVHAFTDTDGRVLLASGSDDATIRLWDPTSQQEQRFLLEGHEDAVAGVCAFTYGERTLLASAGADATVRLWDPATGQQQRVLEGHGGAVNGVCAFTFGGQILLASAGTDGKVLLWDPATGERRRVLEGHTVGVWSVCGFGTGDGRTLLASASDDGTVRVWDPDTGQQQRAIKGHTGGAWSVCALPTSDSQALLAAAGAVPTVRIWDPATGQQQRAMKGHPGLVWSVCGFTSGGQTLLAAAGDDETVRVWDPATGQQQRALNGHTGGAWSVCALPAGDGTALLACAGHDAMVRIWDPATGQLEQAFDCRTDELWCVCAFTSNGRTLLASAGNDSVVRIWDPATGEFQRALEGHTGTVWETCALTIANNRTLLASASDDETVRVWDPATGELQHALDGHTGGAWSLCAVAAEDGRTLLASASGDRKVRIWDPATGEMLEVLEGHTAGVWSVCSFTRSGRVLLASCADDATARVWDVTTSRPLQVIPVHLMPHAVQDVAGRLVVGLSAGLLTIELNLES
jgi:WD40 repeat protein